MELLILLCVVCAALGCWIAGQKNRPGSEGLILGLLLGFIGVIIEALLPTPPAKPTV